MTTPTAAPRVTVPASSRHHLLSVKVENKSGVLIRVAGLFSRRGFNISSLAVAPTDDERFSRISIVVDVESAPLQQVVDQLDKLVNVVEITELGPEEAVVAELLLATVYATPATIGRLETELAELGGTLLESSDDLATVMFAGAPDELDGLEATLGTFGIVELQRTGRIALPALGRS